MTDFNRAFFTVFVLIWRGRTFSSIFRELFRQPANIEGVFGNFPFIQLRQLEAIQIQCDAFFHQLSSNLLFIFLA